MLTVSAPSRVLVVDDEPSVRMVTRLMLERAGHTAEESGDAAGALSRLESKPSTVVLLDVTLPDRSGTDLIPELRRLVPDARIILMSGLSEEDLPNHGADGYLPKPFNREQLLTAVRTALDTM